MGNDGGSIPKRRELVKEAARLPTSSELKATALESQAHAWSTCPISAAPLDPRNTVSDGRGRLYDYETVLRCLMPSAPDDATADADADREGSQSQEAAEFARTGIRSLRDVVKLRFKTRSDNKATAAGGGGGNEEEVRICPLSQKELGAAVRAAYVVPCGHVFAEAVVKELLAAEDQNGADTGAGGRTSHCPECSEAYAVRDIVPILPTDEADAARCAARMEALRALGLAHNLKKDKSAGAGKKKKRKAAAAAEGGEDDSARTRERATDGDSAAQREKKQKKKRDGDDISSRINNPMTATLTAKVLAEQNERNRQRKLAAAAR
ncbi:Rtf2 RING-finger-domain-containing protein [Xylaria palmicola]|nr:Rtf2 RING-finger-domain-containing protein [Xylaria palmicola]